MFRSWGEGKKFLTLWPLAFGLWMRNFFSLGWRIHITLNTNCITRMDIYILTQKCTLLSYIITKFVVKIVNSCNCITNQIHFFSFWIWTSTFDRKFHIKALWYMRKLLFVMLDIPVIYLILMFIVNKWVQNIYKNNVHRLVCQSAQLRCIQKWHISRFYNMDIGIYGKKLLLEILLDITQNLKIANQFVYIEL